MIDRGIAAVLLLFVAIEVVGLAIGASR